MRVNMILWMMILVLFTNRTEAQESKAQILVLIHSDNGGTYELAEEFVKGIEKSGLGTAVIKKVRETSHVSLKELPVAAVEELSGYDGIAFGSPVYFGNISTGMSEFLSQTVALWTEHALEGMPATVFMSAGSGAGRELALQAFWNSLAVHGMVLVPNGIRGMEEMDKGTPQGNSVLGTTSLASLRTPPGPSEGERRLAQLQGTHFAKVARALRGTFRSEHKPADKAIVKDVNTQLREKGIFLPNVPKPAGNYEPYIRTGNLVFINQVALKDGSILNPGKLGKDLNEQQVKEATEWTMLNVLSVLKDAAGGDLNNVVRCVQLTGIFNTVESYTGHAALMNSASDLVVELLGEKGKHARATFGASSLPVNSSVEIQAVFEIK